MSNTNNTIPEKNEAMPLKLDVRVRPITPKENLVGFAAVTLTIASLLKG